MLVGRNIPVGEHAREAFYRLESDRGQSIFQDLCETRSERTAREMDLQPRLL
jgi:hypothetical protein